VLFPWAGQARIEGSTRLLRINDVDGDTMVPLFLSCDHLLIHINRRAASLEANLKCGVLPRAISANIIADLSCVLVRLNLERYSQLRDDEAVFYWWDREFISGAIAAPPMRPTSGLRRKMHRRRNAA